MASRNSRGSDDRIHPLYLPHSHPHAPHISQTRPLDTAMNNIKFIIVIVALVLSACAAQTPPPPTVDVQGSAVALAWLSVTQTQKAIPPTLIPSRTRLPTYTAGPPTSTPTITPIPTATQSPLFAAKHNGFYLVNSEIAPGVWRSDGSGNECYWKVSTATGDIINNHFGMAGGTAYIPATAFQVEFSNCGTWTYLQAP
jgi:hypothetical protein